MYSNMGGGIVDLELPLHLHPPIPHPQFHLQPQLSMKQPNCSYIANNPYKNSNKRGKIQMTQITNSDEEDAGCSKDDESNSIDGLRKCGNSVSPWHRMKWSDNMVRLLIMAVYCIGDEGGGFEFGSDKKKSGPGGAAGLQKRRKWKSVSKAMREKGFCVSPQQCEDKFNDLNKRYKRVNDILGKGTACRVVENHGLIDALDLSPKLKDEVKKLLNSKHLFFREMCAYHNSCNHGSGGPTVDPVSAPTSSVSSLTPSQQQQHELVLHSKQMQHPTTLHNNSHKGGLGIEENGVNEDDDESEDEYEEGEEEHGEGKVRKKARTMEEGSRHACQALQQLDGEVMGMLGDSSKSSWEKKEWVMRRVVELEEEGVKFQWEALELEKQRLKWMKYSGKKEREMERMKIENEKKRLENQRMVLLLRKKELDLLQHPSNLPCVT